MSMIEHDNIEYEKHGKRYLRGNQWYRLRRGKMVLIPEEWLRKITHDKTKRKRKQIQEVKKQRSYDPGQPRGKA